MCNVECLKIAHLNLSVNIHVYSISKCSLRKKWITFCNMPNIIVMSGLWQVFSDPLLNLQMAVGHNCPDLQIIAPHPVHKTLQTSFLHAHTVLHFITLQNSIPIYLDENFLHIVFVCVWFLCFFSSCFDCCFFLFFFKVLKYYTELTRLI